MDNKAFFLILFGIVMFFGSIMYGNYCDYKKTVNETKMRLERLKAQNEALLLVLEKRTKQVEVKE